MKAKLYVPKTRTLRADIYVSFRAIAFLLLAAFSLIGKRSVAQTLSFTQLTSDYSRPQSGAEYWYNGYQVSIPGVTGQDRYYRFNWAGLNPGQGQYNWTLFDQQVNTCIDNKQKFSFGIMAQYPGGNGSVNIASFGGGASAYPEWVHNQMQSESVKDYIYQGDWVPNWNSPSFLDAMETFNIAVYQHLSNTTYKGIKYKDVINYVDIRGYGSFGEWHNYPQGNHAGTDPTAASLIRMIDIHKTAYPDLQLQMMVDGLDGGGWSNIPAQVSYKLLTDANSHGEFGIRRDSWGATEAWYNENLWENNPGSYNGQQFKTLIMNKWKNAPITGEPCCASGYAGLITQVTKYHVLSFGNGNYGAVTGSNVITASQLAGARIALTGGSVNTANGLSVTLNWQNKGAAPVYDDWDIVYELKNNSNTTVWSGNSGFTLNLFLPQASSTSYTDNFTLPGTVAAGTYKLNLIIKDPKGFINPYPLGITGRNTDGSYTLTNVTVSAGSGPSNQSPVADAGANQVITLPISLATLNSSNSYDPDGTIASRQWQQISGPAISILSSTTATTITVTNLITGTYTYRLTVTDNNNATATDDVTVAVNAAPPANQPPVANAGPDRTITLPTNSTTLNGNGSTDPDGTIASYQWQRISGPNNPTLSSTTTANITVSNLVAGTYVYRLTVTDNSGATDTDDATITVNAAVNQPPIANAGPDRTITLPTSSTTLNGTGSSDPDGTIASYQWQRISGPNNPALSSTTTATITVSNLVAGTYIYRLTVTDNSGATDTDDVTIIVNAAANVPPVADAGTSQTIILPTNSANLSSSASSDPDGTIVSRLWQQVSGPNTSALSSTTATNITVNNLIAGTYVYRLTVTDNNGATATDNVTVTVNPAANVPPVADAGNNQTITLPTSSATLNGNSSYDPDGVISSYQWQQVGGPGTSTLSSTTSANITVSNLIAGTYTYRLTVTDNNGATDIDNVTVTVNSAPPANEPPVANAGPNRTIILPTNSANLNGSSSYDPDGSITAYQWQRLSGPNTPTLSSTTTATITVSNLIAGTYVYRLTVTDNSGASSTDDVTITVNQPGNAPPVANAGANRTIVLPTNTSNLNGTSSYDPDGTIVSYQWQQVSGPNNSTLSATNTSSVTAGNLVLGAYVYRLTVTDNSGATATDQVTVIVSAAANQPPVADAGPNRTIILPTNTTVMNGSSSYDPDGTIVSYQWIYVSGPNTPAMSAPTAASNTLTNLVAGTYVYRLTVTDNSGASTTDQVTITVNAASNIPPVADAGSGQTILLPANSANLSGAASYDPDGTIVSYQWQQVSGPNTSTFSATNVSSVTVSNLVAGTYRYRLTVTDNAGATGTDEVIITVNTAANIPPVAEAGINQVVTLSTNSATLNGSASNDPDGQIVSYKWERISGPAVPTFSSTTTAIAAVTGLQAGDYTFRLTVTDNQNASATDTVKVAVIDNFSGHGDAVIYPNPASEIVNVSLRSPAAGKLNVRISDISGKQVMPTVEVDKPQGVYTTSVNVSALPPGTYILEVIVNKSSKTVSKFLKL